MSALQPGTFRGEKGEGRKQKKWKRDKLEPLGRKGGGPHQGKKKEKRKGWAQTGSKKGGSKNQKNFPFTEAK